MREYNLAMKNMVKRLNFFFPNRQSLFGHPLPPLLICEYFLYLYKCVRLRQIDIMFQVSYTKNLKSGSSIISGILESIHFLKTFTIPTFPYFIIYNTMSFECLMRTDLNFVIFGSYQLVSYIKRYVQ